MPWFFVTVRLFEEMFIGQGAAERQVQRCTPCKVIIVGVLIVTCGPLALVLFFIPYFVFAVVLRPLCLYVLPIFCYFLVRAVVELMWYFGLALYWLFLGLGYVIGVALYGVSWVC